MSIAVVVLLTGCATAYQPQGATGGFSSSQLDENVFQVSFKGNGYTDRDKANDYALLRSAEIALEKGYSYFIIVDAQQYAKNSTYTTPVTATTNISSNAYGSSYTAKTTFSGGEAYNISRPRATNTIICFKDKPNVFSYRAEFVVKSLKEKYGLSLN